MRKASTEKSKPVNILYTSSFGNMQGGGQRSLYLLLKGLDRSRFTPFLICPEDGELVNAARDIDVKVNVVPTPPLKKCSFSTITFFRRFLTNNKIALIHTDGPRHTVYLGIAAMFSGIPIVWHVRVGDSESPLYDRLLFTLSDKVIAVSRATAARFSGINNSHKMVIIYNSIDLIKFHPSRFSPSIRDTFATSSQVLIGTVGQLHPKKGQETLLDAAAIIEKELPAKVKFLIIGRGNGDYTKKLEDKVKDLGLQENVIFAGFRDDIPELMAALDIFILPTTFKEGFSRVIIEAQAAGKPVITTDLGGNPEAVTDGYNGFLLSHDAPPQVYADTILNLVQDNGLRDEMGLNARTFAEKNFNIEENIRKTEKIYGELLDE